MSVRYFLSKLITSAFSSTITSGQRVHRMVKVDHGVLGGGELTIADEELLEENIEGIL